MDATDFWDKVRQLQGRTLHSVARGKAYDVVEVTNDRVTLHVQDGGRTRFLFRDDLEPFYRKLVTSGELTAADLKSVYVINIPLAAAILAAMDGVSAETRPIHLHYRRP